MNIEQAHNLKLKELLLNAKEEIQRLLNILQLLSNNNVTDKFIDKNVFNTDIISRIEKGIQEDIFTEINLFVCESCIAFQGYDVLVPMEIDSPYTPFKKNNELYIKSNSGCPYCNEKTLRVLFVRDINSLEETHTKE